MHNLIINGVFSKSYVRMNNRNNEDLIKKLMQITENIINLGEAHIKTVINDNNFSRIAVQPNLRLTARWHHLLSRTAFFQNLYLYKNTWNNLGSKNSIELKLEFSKVLTSIIMS